MFIVSLSTSSPPYVTGYVVASIVTYNKYYLNTPNVLFIKATDLQGIALKKFIQNFQNYFVQNGKLVLDTTKK